MQCKYITHYHSFVYKWYRKHIWNWYYWCEHNTENPWFTQNQSAHKQKQPRTSSPLCRWILWNFNYEISPTQAILPSSCAITQAAYFTTWLQYVMMSNLDIYGKWMNNIPSCSHTECSISEVPFLFNSNYAHMMWSIARLLNYTPPINENCLNWNDYIDVFVQDYENGTVYAGDAVEVGIFAVEVVESDDDSCNGDEDM